MHRRWFVNRTNPEYIKYLSKTAAVSPVLAQILINRGIKTSAEINNFLNPQISQLSDPFDMPDVKSAVDRIMTARKENERVLVHGDYDVDGLSATAIMIRILKLLGIDCDYFIPDRMKHGYGFKQPAVKKAKQSGASLIITVDCGITSFEAASLCKKEGIDVIITDHHEPIVIKDSPSPNPPPRGGRAREGVTCGKFLLPDAVAVINPKISDLQSPAANLSGAGVAFKLAQALVMRSDMQFSMHDLLDLAALGTMADVVPLTGENRLIVRDGLRLMENGSRPGLQALKKVSGIDRRIMKTGILLFTVIPRINAAGRLSDAHNVIKLLLTDSENESTDISSWLDKLNAERQQTEEKVYQEALHQLHCKEVRSVIVLSSEGWHKGVIGIVASRIAETFYRPTFIFSVGENVARGSARSIPSFNLYGALTCCKEFLRGFGGHKQAAGLDLDAENIPSFEEQIIRIADEALTDKDFIPALEIDADIALSDISFDLTREFDMLEPFGFGNPEPLLGSRGLDVLYPRIIKNNHLKMKLRHKSRSLDAIGFDMASFFERHESLSKVDAAFTLSVNEWGGSKSLQLHLKALRPSQEKV